MENSKACFPKIDWSHINTLLKTQGLPPILLYTDDSSQEIPDLPSLSETLLRLLSKKDFDSRSSESVFKAFMDRVPSDSSALDGKVINLIQYFQARSEILTQVTSQLGLEDYLQVPSAVAKLQECMMVLPRLSEFLNAMCAEINTPKGSIEEALVRIKVLKKDAGKLSAICKHMEATGKEVQERAKAIAQFCNLFDVKGDTVKAVEQVYQFVLEIKNFLAVNFI